MVSEPRSALDQRVKAAIFSGTVAVMIGPLQSEPWRKGLPRTRREISIGYRAQVRAATFPDQIADRVRWADDHHYLKRR